MATKEHAQILSDIARQVVEQHRHVSIPNGIYRAPGDAPSQDGLIGPVANAVDPYPCWHPAAGACPNCDPGAWIDDSWNYVLPERFQG